jgi:hypothetical protein
MRAALPPDVSCHRGGVPTTRHSIWSGHFCNERASIIRIKFFAGADARWDFFGIAKIFGQKLLAV